MAIKPRALGLVLALSVSSIAGRALAGSEQEALAEQLFDEARKLVAGQHYAEACDKFAESQRLAPAPGTLANLAVCHETIGKTATAWVEMKRVEADDQASGNNTRRGLITTHLAALESALSHIALQIDPGAGRTKDLVITIDDVVIGAAAWGSLMPFDPGTHVVVASAPGKKRWETTVSLGGSGDTRTIPIAPLADAEAPPLPPPAGVAPSALPPPADSGAHHDTRLLGGVVAGLGVVGVGIGSYFGLKALSDRNASDAQCVPGCTQQAVDLNTSAKTEATASTVGFGVGVAGLAVGAYLFLTGAPASLPRAARVEVVPWSTTRVSGMGLRGSW